MFYENDNDSNAEGQGLLTAHGETNKPHPGYSVAAVPRYKALLTIPEEREKKHKRPYSTKVVYAELAGDSNDDKKYDSSGKLSDYSIITRHRSHSFISDVERILWVLES